MVTPSRPPLSTDRVLAAAVVLADEEGLEALTMRRLAKSLGVEAMSLYNHVANKAALLDGILDRVVSEVELPSPAEAWDVQLRQLARSFRRVGDRHPNIFPLFGTRAIRSVEGFAPLECAYDILRQAGLDPDAALDAFIALASYVLGFVQTEHGGLRAVADGETVDFETLDPAAHPRLVELGMAFAARDSDREFDFGLELFVEGVRRRLVD